MKTNPNLRPLALLVALAASAAVSACGGDELDPEAGAEPALEASEEALAIGFNPGDAPVINLEAEPTPQEIPVCNDCQLGGTVRLTQTATGVGLTLTGTSNYARLAEWGVGGSFVASEDRLYLAERINGVYQRSTYWLPVGPFYPREWAWNRTVSSKGTVSWTPSTGVKRYASTVTMVNAPAGATDAANWRSQNGAPPRFRAELIAYRSDGVVGVIMPVPFTP
ncbi:hypothetical protein L6V77_04190 [Myxococcota bacterium]|nr:hypothetical protein [Myxococcota bacterium]